MTDLERKLKDIIYGVICDIENDLDDKLTIHDIYKKLLKVKDIDYNGNKALEAAMEDLI